MPKMLKQTTTGRMYVWSEILAKRKDMELCDDRAPELPAAEALPDVSTAGPFIEPVLEKPTKNARGRKKRG